MHSKEFHTHTHKQTHAFYTHETPYSQINPRLGKQITHNKAFFSFSTKSLAFFSILMSVSVIEPKTVNKFILYMGRGLQVLFAFFHRGDRV